MLYMTLLYLELCVEEHAVCAAAGANNKLDFPMTQIAQNLASFRIYLLITLPNCYC